jgi:hypothetical protein
MRKNPTRDYIIFAFRLYAIMKSPSLSEIEKMNYDTSVKQDLMAVSKTFDYFLCSGNTETCKAIKAVYFYDNKQGETNQRVLAFAQENYISERNVWRMLNTACNICASFRGLNTKSIKEFMR